MQLPQEPRSLRDPAATSKRRCLLDLPHMTPLAAFAMQLRAHGLGDVPDFDPLDGGIAATTLFLFEKPGPMTDPHRPGKRMGSGFISQENDDPTAETIFCFMRAAGIDRPSAVLWNAVPWWNGTRRIAAQELREGEAALEALLLLLPDLRSIVLVGTKAGRVAARLSRTSLTLLRSAHPSPIVRATRREAWDRIPILWSAARADQT